MSLLKALGLALIITFGVLAVPVILDGTQDNTVSMELKDGNTQTFNTNLEATLDATSSTDATVTIQDRSSLESETSTITEGEEYVYQFEGGNVTVLAQSVATGSADLIVSYDSIYGWSPESKTLVNNFPLILVAFLTGIIILYGVKV